MKNKKNTFFCCDTNAKKFENLTKKKTFFKKINFFKLNLNSTHFKLFLKVHNIEFAQNFEVFIFLAMNFSSMTNFILQPLVTKIIIIGNGFCYLQTAKDQNIPF